MIDYLEGTQSLKGKSLGASWGDFGGNLKLNLRL